MDAPRWICRKLHEFHPQLRLGWDGEGQTFGLIQLYLSRAAEKSFREPWGHRGPIFSRTGRPTPDYDLLQRVPIYLIDVSVADVYSGKILKLVKRWARPIAARIHESAIEQGKRVESHMEGLGREMADKIYREGQRNGAGAPIVAKKFCQPTRNQMRVRAGELDFTESQLPPPPPGGWAKYLAEDKKDDDSLGEISTAA